MKRRKDASLHHPSPFLLFTMLKRLLPLLLFVLLLTGCSIATPPGNPTPGTTPIVGAPEQPLTPVTFLVTVPSDTPPGQPIQFSLLDEVTGLAINPTRYLMEEKEDFIYEITLDLPVGAVIQYRYSRQGALIAEEHITDGRQVRYRLYKVDGPSNVHDVVTRWNDTLYNLPAGRIIGKITDSTTGQPVPNLLIAAGGAQTLTAWDGTFRMDGLPVGTHNLVAYALDGTYHTFQQGAVVAENASTPAEFSVIPTTLVDVTFRLKVPEDTIPAVPVRIAGNLYQFGNTFANLSGGVSVAAARMPVLTYQADGSYALTMKLPAGTFLRYKYTLGDGFWNAERDATGGVPLREVVIPPEGLILDDTVETWASVGKAPVWFDVV
ncbi:MAG TPA: carboxypeptidase-like regulatory domain-containing protein, partial [Anaerolineales bacterium]|nr:carboxypeptidase-like regulatory domain-containing protein [Anaerolineales bacterium]